jgi:hypothetical protein
MFILPTIVQPKNAYILKNGVRELLKNLIKFLGE